MNTMQPFLFFSFWACRPKVGLSKNLKLAGYEENPIEDEELSDNYKLINYI